MIHTRYGTISVTVQGASDRTPLLTFPEVGLNHTQCFQPLLSAAADRPLFLDNFCILHIDPPGTGAGLEEVGKELRTEPSIDAYVDMVHIVLSHFQVGAEISNVTSPTSVILTGLCRIFFVCASRTMSTYYYDSGACSKMALFDTQPAYRHGCRILTHAIVSPTAVFVNTAPVPKALAANRDEPVVMHRV